MKFRGKLRNGPGKVVQLNHGWYVRDMVAVSMVELRTVAGASLFVRERPLDAATFAQRVHAPGEWIETTTGSVRFDQIGEIRDYLWHTFAEAIQAKGGTALVPDREKAS